jgi:hypothetical protein
MADNKSAHLTWLKSAEARTFVPKYPHDYQETSYYDIMKYIYAKPACSQQLAEQMFLADKLHFKSTLAVIKNINKIVEKSQPTPSQFHFVTIGFNHQEFTIDACHIAIQKILKMDWVKSAKANLEYHRENGTHPHVHFIIETPYLKGKIVDSIFKPKYMKKLVLKKNFIDVKTAQECHYKYINLEKQESKMSYVKQDQEWRQKNKIPDYEKNWKVCDTPP